MPQCRLSKALVLCLLVLCGCGTVVNFREENDPKLHFDSLVPPASVYGGMRLDACFVDQAFTTPFDDPADPLRAVKRVPFLGLCIVDLPLCAVADTFTAPLTIYATAMRKQGPDQQSSDGSR